MKNKMIYIIFIVFLLSIFLLPNINLAHSIDEIMSDEWLSTGNNMAETIDKTRLKEISNTTFNIFVSIGIVVMFVIGTGIGIKFIVSSVDEKAKIKQILIQYIVGCAVILGAFTIWSITINVMNQSFGITETELKDEEPEEPEEPEKEPEEEPEEEQYFSDVIVAEKPPRAQRQYHMVTSYSKIPASIKGECKNAGSLVNVPDKRLVIYLPYKYSEDKQYDVLLLAHGLNGNEHDWLETMGTPQNSKVGKNIVDNMIDQELCDPLIIVCFGYDSYNGTTDYNLIKSKLQNDILPYLAKNYATYVKCDSTDNLNKIKTKIIEQRDHFGIAGLSLGAVVTADLLTKSTDYFSYFGIFSGYLSIFSFEANAPTINYIYLTVGSSDESSKQYMTPAYNTLKNRPNVKYCEYDIFTGDHEWSVWHASLYNTLQKFFDY